MKTSRRKTFSRLLAAIATVWLFLPAWTAQTPARRGAREDNSRAAVRTVEVHPDRTVTFRLDAPEATSIVVSGDFAVGEQEMTRDGKGVWSVTVGPIKPAIYNYGFRINGFRINDPANPIMKVGNTGATVSMFQVPGDKPAVYDLLPVPHGTVHVALYPSKTAGVDRSMHVYTPPGYETGRARYPVLYLLHGSGDTDSGWVTAGRANLILDNLIASGAAKPMIVVMPNGRAVPPADLLPPANPGSTDRNAFTGDLLNDIIPYIERNYRVSAKADHRALAGLSMGGGQALRIGLTNLDTFHSVGVFSSAIRNESDREEQFATLFPDPAVANKKLKLFYIACGKTDSVFPAAESMSGTLKERRIDHKFTASEDGHVWRNWRDYLAEMTPLLFR